MDEQERSDGIFAVGVLLLGALGFMSMASSYHHKTYPKSTYVEPYLRWKELEVSPNVDDRRFIVAPE